MSFTITDNEPIPPTRVNEYKWPFHKMVVGQCVIIDDLKAWPFASRAAHACGTRRGWRFKCWWQKDFTPEIKAQGVGKIWRVE